VRWSILYVFFVTAIGTAYYGLLSNETDSNWTFPASIFNVFIISLGNLILSFSTRQASASLVNFLNDVLLIIISCLYVNRASMYSPKQ
jgi:hypothetical protein